MGLDIRFEPAPKSCQMPGGPQNESEGAPDNAVAESTIELIEAELTDRVFDNLLDAEKELFEYITEFYNRQ